LNRRLAPDVYLGVDALTLDDTGRLCLGGAGRPVDWLVHMRRLPSERFLDAVMAAGPVHERDLEAAADVLAAFYRKAARQRVTLADYGGRLTATLDRAEIRLGREPALAPRFQAVAGALRNVIDGRPEFLAVRVRDGRIVEGHGDLRPEHVCLTDPPVVIDCIEFEPVFRQVDPAEELAFLWMETEVAGQGWVGERLGQQVMDRLGDHPPLRLWEFHRAMRAVLRAELALSHLEDVPGEARDHWRARAATYLAAAGRHAGLFLEAPLPA
jgi:aminoglycoside phosphotransferase family enzyme